MSTDRIERIARRFERAFDPQTPHWRTVGREAELPVVGANGEAFPLDALWAPLQGELEVKREGDLIVGLEGPDYAYSAEVGRGTIEVITGPQPDLHALADVHDTAVQRLVRAAHAAGARVLGYGIQPLTPASDSLMCGKQRYGALHEALGDAWLWFTVTASDQVHVDIGRSELIDATNLGNLVAPALIALCANSPVYGGVSASVCSARELQMGRIEVDRHRHGMPAGPFRDVGDLVRTNAGHHFLIERVDGRAVARSDTFVEYAAGAAHDDLFDDYLLHEHYIWNTARPRSAHSTLELRCACQQPWSERHAAMALGLALVEAGALVSAFLDDALGGDPWPAMHAWHAEVVRDGLAAPEPHPGLLRGIVERCDEALRRRARGEEQYLAPIWRRLDGRANPAQHMASVFAQGGIEALVDAAAIPAE